MVQDGGGLPRRGSVRFAEEIEDHPRPSMSFPATPSQALLGAVGAFGLQIRQPLALAAICNVAPVKRGARLPGGGEAAAPLPPQPTGPSSLLASGGARRRPWQRRRGHRLLVQLSGSPHQPAGVAFPAQLPLQEPGMMETGWLGVSPTAAFMAPRVISGREGPVPSRMGQGRWQRPTLCPQLCVDSQPNTFQRC